MSDRELLELAAKAAGYDLTHVTDSGGTIRTPTGMKVWAPLADDGDALRLAVKLGIEPGWYERSKCAQAQALPASGHVIKLYEFGSDPYAATRRAIVSAAAEIGRTATNPSPIGSKDGRE